MHEGRRRPDAIDEPDREALRDMTQVALGRRRVPAGTGDELGVQVDASGDVPVQDEAFQVATRATSDVEDQRWSRERGGKPRTMSASFDRVRSLVVVDMSAVSGDRPATGSMERDAFAHHGRLPVGEPEPTPMLAPCGGVDELTCCRGSEGRIGVVPEKEIPMSLPKIVSQEEWTAARRALLEKEKDLTRQRDRLNTERRELPMVEVTKPYEFEGPDGMLSLLDLFEGRPQLIVYHFMFHPDWEDGCPSCSAGTDELAPGFIEHLNIRDTTYALVSRAPSPSSSGGRPRRAGRSRGTPPTTATSATTSAPPSTPHAASTSSTTAPSTSTPPWARRA